MDESIRRRTVVINLPQGLHARPAALFVKVANRFKSKIEIVRGAERVDGTSILSLLTLAASEGTELSIEAAGQDADEALDALAELVKNNFAEEESCND